MGIFDGLSGSQVTPEQEERLARLRNPAQRKAIRKAIRAGQPIPESVWAPLPDGLDVARFIKREVEAAAQSSAALSGGQDRPASSAQGDSGLEVLAFLYETLGIDATWSIREPRGFTWWGGALAQRVWAEPARESVGHSVVRLHAETALVRDVSASDGVVAKLNLANRVASLSALVWDEAGQRVSAHCSAVVHPGNLAWMQRLFAAAVLIQVATAHARGALLAQFLGGQIDTLAHPTSGQRRTEDEVFGVLKVYAEKGQGRSPFGAEDFEATLQMRPEPWLVASGGGASLTADFAFSLDVPAALAATTGERPGTALLVGSGEDRHPQLGSGALLRLSLPVVGGPGTLQRWALEMNAAETQDWPTSHLLGAWTADEEVGLTFVTFLPAGVYEKGILQNMILAMGMRAQWAQEHLSRTTSPRLGTGQLATGGVASLRGPQGSPATIQELLDTEAEEALKRIKARAQAQQHPDPTIRQAMLQEINRESDEAHKRLARPPDSENAEETES